MLDEYGRFVRLYGLNDSLDVVVSASDDQIIGVIVDKDRDFYRSPLTSNSIIELLNNFASVKTIEGWDVKNKLV